MPDQNPDPNHPHRQYHPRDYQSQEELGSYPFPPVTHGRRKDTDIIRLDSKEWFKILAFFAVQALTITLPLIGHLYSMGNRISVLENEQIHAQASILAEIAERKEQRREMEGEIRNLWEHTRNK